MSASGKPLLALAAAVLLAAVAVAHGAERGQGPWVRIEAGLELGTFLSPIASETGDSLVRILRIDPSICSLRLLNASASDAGEALTAREWCARHGLVAAINASMYQEDHRTSVSLMRTRGHVNNAWLSKDMSILAFDRLDPGVPEIQIVDRECQDFGDLRKRYGTLIQSIRMVSCKGENVWTRRPRHFSIAAVGIDAHGRILFMHARSPYSTHDFIEVLLGLPVELRRAMYVEGGVESQLYVRGGGREYEFVGSYEGAFISQDDKPRAHRVPNVIGVARRP